AEIHLQVKVPQVRDQVGAETPRPGEGRDIQAFDAGEHVAGDVSEDEDERRGGNGDDVGEEGGEADRDGGQDGGLEEGEEGALEDDAALPDDEVLPGDAPDDGKGRRALADAEDEVAVVEREPRVGHHPEGQEENAGEDEDSGDEGEDEAQEFSK